MSPRWRRHPERLVPLLRAQRAVTGPSPKTRERVQEERHQAALAELRRSATGWQLTVLEGLVLSAGGRINGVTVRDVIGGGDLYFRRPGYEIYFEPGFSWRRGHHTVSLETPLRVYQNKLDSLLDRSLHRKVGADFAPYLIVVSYGRRL